MKIYCFILPFITEIVSGFGFEEQDWIVDRDFEGENSCLINKSVI
jgi:hypothetical protein